MTRSLLTELIEQQTRTSLVTAIARHTDAAAEELARELLRDPQFRADLIGLLRAAFTKALAELQQPPPP